MYPVLDRIRRTIDGMFIGRPSGSAEDGVWYLYNNTSGYSLMDEIQFELSEGLLTRSRPRTEAEVSRPGRNIPE